ncbi:MAG: asparagine synthase-related protein [bacterium]
MNALCGAWNLSGGPVGEKLSGRERAAIIEAAGGKPGRVEEMVSGPLWLAAAPGKTAGMDCAFAGLEGFITSGPGSASALNSLLKSFGHNDAEFEPQCAGDWVMAFADVSRGRLSLFRDFSGCERLYFTLVREQRLNSVPLGSSQTPSVGHRPCFGFEQGSGSAGGLLLFSSSIRPLLAHPAVPRAVDPDTFLEFAFLGITAFGDATAFAEIREVLPGHRLDVSSEGLSHRWYWKQSFEPVEYDPTALGERLWKNLLDNICNALGADREAAVSLSGGIDSAAVAAALAEVLGPDRVHAFTYEFAESPQPSEVPFATLVCRRLGIRRHTVKKINFSEHITAVPEIIWLLENTWRPFTNNLLTARLVASHGYSQYFSGAYMGEHFNYLREVAESWLTAPALMRFYWRRAICRRRWRMLSALHPGLDTTVINDLLLYFPVLCVLRHNGIIDSLSDFYPEPLGSMAEEMSVRPRIKEALAQTRGWPLTAQIQFHTNLIHHNSGGTRSRQERVSRLAGARQVRPLDGRCNANLINIPSRDRPSFWNYERRVMPGKLILREAVREKLPREVVSLSRVRRLGAPPMSWWSESSFLRRMEPHVASSAQSLRPMFGGHWGELRRSFGIQLTLHALWHALLIERPPRPTWEGFP